MKREKWLNVLRARDKDMEDELVKLEVTLTGKSYDQFREVIETAESEGEISDISIRIIS